MGKKGVVYVVLLVLLCSFVLADFEISGDERLLRGDFPGTEFSNVGLSVGTFEGDDGNALAYSIVRFSFDNVYFDVDEIEKAELVIEVNGGSVNALEVEVSRIVEDWDRATFGDVPGVGSSFGSVILNNEGSYNVDITDLVIDWMNNGNNNGVLIKEQNENVNMLSDKEVEVSLRLTFKGCGGCPDVNDDGNVDIFDLVKVATKLFSGDIKYDLNDDDKVRLGDVFCVARSFGEEIDCGDFTTSSSSTTTSTTIPLEDTATNLYDLDGDGNTDQAATEDGTIIYIFQYEKDAEGNVLRRTQIEAGTGETVSIQVFNSNGDLVRVTEFSEAYREREISFGDVRRTLVNIETTTSFNFLEDQDGKIIIKDEHISEQESFGGSRTTTSSDVISRFSPHGELLFKIFKDSQGNRRIDQLSIESSPWKGENHLPTLMGGIIDYETLMDGEFVTGSIVTTLEDLEYEYATVPTYNSDPRMGDVGWGEDEVFRTVYGSGTVVSREFDLPGRLIRITRTFKDNDFNTVTERFAFTDSVDTEGNVIGEEKWRLSGDTPTELVELIVFATDDDPTITKTIYNYGGGQLNLEISNDLTEDIVYQQTDTSNDELFLSKVFEFGGQLNEFNLVRARQKYTYDYPYRGNSNFVQSEELKYDANGDIVLRRGEPLIETERWFDGRTGYLSSIRYRVESEAADTFTELFSVGSVDYEQIASQIQSSTVDPFLGKEEVIVTNNWLDSITGAATTETEVLSFSDIEAGFVYLTPRGSQVTKHGENVITREQDGTELAFARIRDSLGRMNWDEISRSDLDFFSPSQGSTQPEDPYDFPREFNSYVPDSIRIWDMSAEMYYLINEFFKAFPEAEDWMTGISQHSIWEAMETERAGVNYNGASIGVSNAPSTGTNFISMTLRMYNWIAGLANIIEAPDTSKGRNILLGTYLSTALSEAFLQSKQEMVMLIILHEAFGHGTYFNQRPVDTLTIGISSTDQARLDQLQADYREIYTPISDLRDQESALYQAARREHSEASEKYYQENGVWPSRAIMNTEQFLPPEYHAVLAEMDAERDRLAPQLDEISAQRQAIRDKYNSIETQPLSARWQDLKSSSQGQEWIGAPSDYGQTNTMEFQAEWARRYGVNTEKEYKDALEEAENGNDIPLRAMHLTAETISTRDTTRFFHLNNDGSFTVRTVQVRRNEFGRINRIILPD